ncbi:macoilin isoform X2 [Exaiptasia diaphana]|uniref:Macoilin n=1 Tax=Exaiptasia diaphana TaxID=2652724 RepID=A0A913WXG5_EXADI|nr:macoilin isoform X2 [Exaiptasia diaphana]KXJ17085.1 Macoilin [Exaiptasia diaphana]
MKRRTIDPSKLRRHGRRSRITESIYGSVFLYIRFFLVWILVLTADFLLEFRFEYLWPFWLLLRSAYDSFKYQGLAFSLLFLALALCSDLICLVLLPVHWLFFAASTYVWVQFVWHTDRGLCLPTVSLWLLFVYVEASVRLRELKSLPFHLDLCRPFAAHCIGYPVVTLGYGVKSYVGYKMRQRKMTQVSKENEFYMELINLALPSDPGNSTESNQEKSSRAICNGKVNDSESALSKSRSLPVMTNGINTKSDVELLIAKEAETRGLKLSDYSCTGVRGNHAVLKDLDNITHLSSKKISEDHNLNELDKAPSEGNPRGKRVSLGKGLSKMNGRLHHTKEEDDDDSDSDSLSLSSNSVNNSRKSSRSNSPKGHDTKDNVHSLLNQLKEEKSLRRRAESTVVLLENDIKRVKVELQTSRQCESELRTNMHSLMANERSAKIELQQLKSENISIQHKINTLNSNRQQDRNTISSLERKLKTERDARLLAENQLREERKKQKAECAAQKQREDTTNCHDACISLREEMEEETRQLRMLLSEKDDEIKRLDLETESLRQKTKEVESQQVKKETEILMNALTAMQGKNTHLENSLSSETRLKLDLFSALGETRRQLEIAQSKVTSKERDIITLKAKIAEVMALMPANTYSDTLPCFTSTHAALDLNSSLDPSAPCYVPNKKSNGLL